MKAYGGAYISQASEFTRGPASNTKIGRPVLSTASNISYQGTLVRLAPLVAGNNKKVKGRNNTKISPKYWVNISTLPPKIGMSNVYVITNTTPTKVSSKKTRYQPPDSCLYRLVGFESPNFAELPCPCFNAINQCPSGPPLPFHITAGYSKQYKEPVLRISILLPCFLLPGRYPIFLCLEHLIL